MARQLDLLPPLQDEWRIDDETREIGRRGLAKARAALAEAVARDDARRGLHHRSASVHSDAA